MKVFERVLLFVLDVALAQAHTCPQCLVFTGNAVEVCCSCHSTTRSSQNLWCLANYLPLLHSFLFIKY